MVGAWLRLIVNSAVVAAIAVAAQLGAGNALGIVGWDGPHDPGAWATLLTWVAFSYAVAVLAGAIAGRAALRRQRGKDGLGARVLAAVMAAGGGAAVIGLAWLPAQHLAPPTNVNPGLVVSITAGAGVIVGFLVALLALATPVIAAGAQATVAWVWLLAIGAAVAGLASHEPYPAPRLGVPDAPSVFTESAWTGPRVMLYAAVALGLLIAGIARARGGRRLGTALSGLAGPALVAAAYLIAGPGDDSGNLQTDPYLNALLAAAVGLLASVLVALPGRRSARPTRAAAPAAPDEPIVGDVIESTRAPLTTSSARPADTRPAWASGSGPYARAYTGTAHGTYGSAQRTQPAGLGGSADRAQATAEPTATPKRGTGWDADTLTGGVAAVTPPAGTAPTGTAGRPAGAAGTGGLYRSGSFEPAGSYEPDPTPPPPAPAESASTSRPVRPTAGLGAALMGQPEDPHESWLRDLGASGRHAASD